MNAKEQNNLEMDIDKKSIHSTDQAGRDVRILKQEQTSDLASKYKTGIHEIYLAALKKKIMPYRYIRNMQSISIDEQLKLCQSRVSIIGAGGLGGQVILMLARMGIGELIIVDHDVFDETNLNRQALSSLDTLGRHKAEIAKETVESINPGVKAAAYIDRLDNSNGEKIMAGSDVIVDALDNISDRFILDKIARKTNVPLVHGAVAGFEGQLMTIFPGDAGMENLYGKSGKDESPEKTPVSILGVPAVSPAIIATYQAIEVLKIILKKENLFRNMMIYSDFEKCESRKLYFKKE
ncbi:ThiF family adenylyltransferase [Thermodesulfobacteriota bacterium]